MQELKVKKTNPTWKTQISWTCRKGPGFSLPQDGLGGDKRRQDQDPEYFCDDDVDDYYYDDDDDNDNSRVMLTSAQDSA